MVKKKIRKGYLYRSSADGYIRLANSHKTYIASLCHDAVALHWPHFRQAIPISRDNRKINFVPVEFHSTPDSFTIKMVKEK